MNHKTLEELYEHLVKLDNNKDVEGIQTFFEGYKHDTGSCHVMHTLLDRFEDLYRRSYSISLSGVYEPNDYIEE